jgi:hypothetical protein
MAYQGVASWVVYFWALLNSVWGYMFDLSTGNIVFGRASDGQWVLEQLTAPQFTTKGRDIMDAIMTITHNGLVFLAQISTLLPANALPAT